MHTSMFKPELSDLDLEITSQEAFFDFICTKLIALGYVKEGYKESLIDREKHYPTGLPTLPHTVCIPHSSSDYIEKPFITFSRLKSTIPWSEMGNSVNTLDTRIIMVLGFASETDHIELLQKIIEGVQNDQLIKTLSEAQNVDTILNALKSLET